MEVGKYIRKSIPNKPVCSYLFGPKYKNMSELKETVGKANGKPAKLLKKEKIPFTILPTFQLTSLCCCPYFINLACLRNAIRRQFKIKGGCLSDCAAALCCPTCTLAQVDRHLVHNV